MRLLCDCVWVGFGWGFCSFMHAMLMLCCRLGDCHFANAPTHKLSVTTRRRSVQTSIVCRCRRSSTVVDAAVVAALFGAANGSESSAANQFAVEPTHTQAPLYTESINRLSTCLLCDSGAQNVLAATTLSPSVVVGCLCCLCCRSNSMLSLPIIAPPCGAHSSRVVCCFWLAGWLLS